MQLLAVNAKKYSTKLAKITKFISYSIINPLFKQELQMTNLKKRKFDVVNNTTKTFDNELLEEIIGKEEKKVLMKLMGL